MSFYLQGQSPQAAEEPERGPQRSTVKLKPVYRFLIWQVGFAVFKLSNLLNFVAFAFAAQSLLAALASVQFVSNVVFSTWVLKEKSSMSMLVGIGCIIVGITLLVLFGATSSAEYSSQKLTRMLGATNFVVYIVLAGMLATAAYCYFQIRRGMTIARATDRHLYVLTCSPMLTCVQVR